MKQFQNFIIALTKIHINIILKNICGKNGMILKSYFVNKIITNTNLKHIELLEMVERVVKSLALSTIYLDILLFSFGPDIEYNPIYTDRDEFHNQNNYDAINKK